jgi:hypothetical protein
MAKIYLNWREAQLGGLPMVCATCGDDATDRVDRKLVTVRPGFFCIIRRTVKVSLPYCLRHRVASWNAFLRVTARSIGEDGITLGQVSRDFVDAVWDYRDNRDRYRYQQPIADALPAGRSEEDDEPRPRRRRRSGDDSGRVVYAVLMSILMVVVIAGCGFGMLFFNLFRSGPGRAPVQPGIHRPGGPDIPRPPFRR